MSLFGCIDPSTIVPVAPRRKAGKQARIGRATEDLASHTDGSVVLERIPMGAKRIAGGELIPVRTPYDFAGTVRTSGRSIVFDAKHVADRWCFNVSDEKIVKLHQIRAMVRHGEAGAISGLLIEAEALGLWLWLDWHQLVPWLLPRSLGSVKWRDPVWVILGRNNLRVPFQKLVEFYPHPESGHRLPCGPVPIVGPAPTVRAKTEGGPVKSRPRLQESLHVHRIIPHAPDRSR